MDIQKLALYEIPQFMKYEKALVNQTIKQTGIWISLYELDNYVSVTVNIKTFTDDMVLYKCLNLFLSVFYLCRDWTATP